MSTETLNPPARPKPPPPSLPNSWGYYWKDSGRRLPHGFQCVWGGAEIEREKERQEEVMMEGTVAKTEKLEEAEVFKVTTILSVYPSGPSVSRWGGLTSPPQNEYECVICVYTLYLLMCLLRSDLWGMNTFRSAPFKTPHVSYQWNGITCSYCHAPQKMNYNKFGDPLTFPVAPVKVFTCRAEYLNNHFM